MRCISRVNAQNLAVLNIDYGPQAIDHRALARGPGEMKVDTRMALKYSGPAVDSGLMDVYEASANMIAFSDFVVVLAKHAYGDAVQARASVAGFGRGSFVTDLLF